MMRDFFYNKSDVLVATLIIVIAVIVIYARFGVIMNYPDGEGDSVLPRVEELIDSAIGKVTGGEADAPDAAVSEEVSSAQEPQQTPEAEAQPSQVAEPAAAEQPQPSAPEELPAAQTGAGAASIQITVNAGDAASVIADKLLSAGAITDKQAFLSEVVAQGADSKLKMGTFTIPANSSIQEIIKILVG